MSWQINIPAVLSWISAGIAAAVACLTWRRCAISGAPDEALKRVDRLLYEAKNAGKNRILQREQ